MTRNPRALTREQLEARKGKAVPFPRQVLGDPGRAAIAWGVAISVGVGLFFGYYPATRAANLDPTGWAS